MRTRIVALVLFALCFVGVGCGGSGGSNLSSNAALTGLSASTGTLSPAFATGTLAYTVAGLLDSSVKVVPTAADPGATITVNGSGTLSGTPSPSISIPFGATPVSVTVTAADGTSQRAYVVVFLRPGPTAQEAYLKASNPGAIDHFGWSIALSGDTLVVGALAERSNASGVDGNQADNSADQSGAAYVFVRADTGWRQQAYLKASNTGADDWFGHSVALSGDTLVVGAPQEDSSATGIDGNQANDGAPNSGAAYVFVRSGTSWSQQAYLKASNAETGDQFGRSVALAGDTLVAGAMMEASSATGVNGPQADNGAIQSGAAYVFVRSGTTWAQQAYVKASNTDAFDGFGSSVAVSGDTLVVGTEVESSNATGVNGNQADNSAVQSGAAYVFVRSGATWSQQAYLKASNTGAFDAFGFSVAVSGDTVVVGAHSEASNATGVNGNGADNSASFSGAAYVFVRNGTSWSQQAYLKSSNSQTGDQFGFGVALSGDTMVVGAAGEGSSASGLNGNEADNGAPQSGAAYVFLRTGTAWSQQTYLKASNPQGGDIFGFSVAISPDTIVVAAVQEDSGATGVNGDEANNDLVNSGAVYVFR